MYIKIKGERRNLLLETEKYKHLVKISHIINSTTKMDVVLTDKEGESLCKLVNHAIPSILESDDNGYKYVHEKISKKPSNSYLHYINTYGLEYITVFIQNSDAFLTIGPFISSMSIVDRLKNIISRNRLPIGERNQLEQFYQSLPVLSELEYKHLGELLVNMCHHEFIHAQYVSTVSPKPLLDQNRLKEHAEITKDAIERRYKMEKKLLDAISKGDKEKANHIIHQASAINEFSDRIPESPLRSVKNIAFSLNTLGRFAAERGGVQPVYLHNVSERFAILIEKTTNIPGLNKLVTLMINEYCDLVNTFSSGRYSRIVKMAIDYIMLHLGQHLTLQQIAAEIHVNPSYLSRKFKEETEMTVTEFINYKRVEEAKLYLQRENITITEVAFLVGFNDLNYFSKVFKKFTSMTPSQYVHLKNK